MDRLGFHSENKKFFSHYGIAADSGIPGKHVALLLDTEWKDNPNAQQIYLLSANLLSRIFLNIDFIIPPQTQITDTIPDTGEVLEEKIREIVERIFPGGMFRFLSQFDTREYDGILVVGTTFLSQPVVHVLSDGWYVHLDQEHATAATPNPIGACAAACMGVAELFKHVVSPPESKNCGTLTYSLLDYSLVDHLGENPTLPFQLSLGDVTLAGAGAIGSGFLYTLHALTAVEGTLSILDNDSYSETNLNRYVVADETFIGKRKAVVMAEQITNRHPRLNTTPYHETYEEFARRNQIVTTLISAFDSREIRHRIQSDLPRLILDAATTGSQIELARIDFAREGACLGCHYPPRQETDIRRIEIAHQTGLTIERVRYLLDTNEGVNEADIECISKLYGKDLTSFVGTPLQSVYNREYCGSGRVVTKNDYSEEIIAPLSFISAFAGVLLTAELVKDRITPHHRLKNYLLFDTLKKPNPRFHQWKRESGTCAYCQSKIFKLAFAKKWSGCTIQ